MEQPVQIGLVFPRSGQQLLVSVPARAAEYVQAQHSERNAPRVNPASSSRATRPGNDNDTHA